MVGVGDGLGVGLGVGVAVGVGVGVGPPALGAWIGTAMGAPVLKKPTVAVAACVGLVESKRKLYNVPHLMAFAFGFCARVSVLHVIAPPS